MFPALDFIEFEEVHLMFPFGMLLGHVVCKDGLLVDQDKIVSILDMVAPTLVHKLSTTLDHT
jgi:hypothetical protein